MFLKRFISVLLTLTTVISLLSLLSLSVTADEKEYLFLEQLDENSRAVYDAVASMSYEDTAIKVSLPEPLVFNVGMYISDEETNEIVNSISAVVQHGMDAAIMDLPQIYWLKFGHDGTAFDFSYTFDYFNLTVTEINLLPVIDEAYADTAEIISQLNQAIDDFTVEGEDRYTILKAIHDKLADEIAYFDDEYAHEPYGALVKGKAVCEGYAEAFMLLCEKYDIPCICVLGSAINGSGNFAAHKWNYVQMEDEKWYAVDVTWDDTANGIYYDYFLIGSESIDNDFFNMPFSSSHIPSGDFSGIGLSNFIYPELSSTAYVYEPDNNKNPDDNNNPDDDEDTGDEVVKGDITMDGKINSTDFMQVRKYYLGTFELNDKQIIAADTNNDSKVNSTDFMQIRKHFLGKYNLHA